MIQLYKYITPKILLAVMALSLALMGCEKEDDKIEPKLFLGTENVAASNSEADYAIDFVTNSAWQASTNADWIVIEEASGEKGRHKLVFTVLANEDDERTGVITIAISESESIQVTVVQDAGNLNDIFVKADGTGDGTSWDKAASLDDALALAVDGNVIHIAAGTYIPSVTITGGNGADAGDNTFQVMRNITLKGGYPADASEGAVADPAAHKTILSGAETAYHVVVVSAPKLAGQKVVLDGLTITKGNASSSTAVIAINDINYRRNYGGGIIIGNSTVEIHNSEIIENASRAHVAGLYAFGGAEVTIVNTKVNKNASNSNGGGAWFHESTGYVYNSQFNENSGGTAAGFHAYPNASVYLYNTEIANNKGRSYGAAFYARENSIGVLVNCLITGNTSTSANGGGGVMLYAGSEATIISSTITGNVINGPGGGVYRRLGNNLVSIYNSIISGNTQRDDGPDVNAFEADAEPAVVKSSVVGNEAYDGTGAVVAGASYNPGSMMDADFAPIGASNPVTTHGMTASAIETLGAGMNPALTPEFLTVDFYSTSREGLTTMGAVVATP